MDCKHNKEKKCKYRGSIHNVKDLKYKQQAALSEAFRVGTDTKVFYCKKHEYWYPIKVVKGCWHDK